jgi:uncharacterized protein
MPDFSTWAPALLLTILDAFAPFARYGHLKYPGLLLWIATVVSWGIAFTEYCLAAPANRIGGGAFTTAELKTLQMAITLAVFAIFSVHIRKRI